MANYKMITTTQRIKFMYTYEQQARKTNEKNAMELNWLINQR
jgi:hypothetical protein